MEGQSQGQWSVRTEQILEVNTANVEEMASEAAERFARLTGNDGRDSELAEALDMHEVESEDVRAASGINETMGRDIAELLKLEVKSSQYFSHLKFYSPLGTFNISCSQHSLTGQTIWIRAGNILHGM